MRIASLMSTVAMLAFAGIAGAQVTYSNQPPPYPPAQQGYYPGQPGAPGGTVVCESQNNRTARCRIPYGWGGARLVQQLSNSACIQGRSWGFDGQSIWVSQGCRGRFAQAGSYGGGYPPGQGGTVTCESQDERPQSCVVPRSWRGARLVQQLSKSACVEGGSWGFYQGRVWVTRGCRARFAAWNGGWQPGLGWNSDFAVSCGSPQYRYYFCQVDVGSRGRVVLQRQTSDSACIEGRTWGWNRGGIWVDQGCGGSFLVTRQW